MLKALSEMVTFLFLLAAIVLMPLCLHEFALILGGANG